MIACFLDSAKHAVLQRKNIFMIDGPHFKIPHPEFPDDAYLILQRGGNFIRKTAEFDHMSFKNCPLCKRGQ